MSHPAPATWRVLKHLARSIRIRVYLLANYDVYASWIAPAGTRPPESLIGVARLVLPELRVEIEVTAAQ